jgi:hypothetical protein
MQSPLDNKDFWAGLMLIVMGTATVLIARSYPFGTTLRMGPGYFPTVLGVVLVLFGIYLAIDGLRRGGGIEGSWSPRALIVLPLAFVLFGVLMTWAGFVPALLVLIVVSALASPQFKLGEILLLAAALTVLAVAVFVWGLGLPYPLFAGS